MAGLTEEQSKVFFFLNDFLKKKSAKKKKQTTAPCHCRTETEPRRDVLLPSHRVLSRRYLFGSLSLVAFPILRAFYPGVSFVLRVHDAPPRRLGGPSARTLGVAIGCQLAAAARLSFPIHRLSLCISLSFSVPLSVRRVPGRQRRCCPGGSGNDRPPLGPVRQLNFIWWFSLGPVFSPFFSSSSPTCPSRSAFPALTSSFPLQFFFFFFTPAPHRRPITEPFHFSRCFSF